MNRPIDWSKLFIPGVSPIEIIVRGSLMYLSLLLILRVVLRRQTGTFGITNLLLIVLLADAAQNGMAGEYHSVTDGVLLVGTLVFWSYLLDWLAFRYPALEKLVYSPPLLVVREGRLLRSNMRKEFLTPEELMSQLREQGIESLEKVKAAYMEGDGQISVIKKG